VSAVGCSRHSHAVSHSAHGGGLHGQRAFGHMSSSTIAAVWKVRMGVRCNVAEIVSMCINQICPRRASKRPMQFCGTKKACQLATPNSCCVLLSHHQIPNMRALQSWAVLAWSARSGHQMSFSRFALLFMHVVCRDVLFCCRLFADDHSHCLALLTSSCLLCRHALLRSDVWRVSANDDDSFSLRECTSIACLHRQWLW
jgi:hypothetical protein